MFLISFLFSFSSQLYHGVYFIFFPSGTSPELSDVAKGVAHIFRPLLYLRRRSRQKLQSPTRSLLWSLGHCRVDTSRSINTVNHEQLYPHRDIARGNERRCMLIVYLASTPSSYFYQVPHSPSTDTSSLDNMTLVSDDPNMWPLINFHRIFSYFTGWWESLILLQV